jgi:hypothetical protein
LRGLLRAGTAWAIRRSSSCEGLSCRSSWFLLNRVLNAASHSRITKQLLHQLSTSTDTTLSYGTRSATNSVAHPTLLSSTRRSSPCAEASAQIRRPRWHENPLTSAGALQSPISIFNFFFEGISSIRRVLGFRDLLLTLDLCDDCAHRFGA